METGILITTILLVLFAILAVIDGFYLHIFKYKLHLQKDSKFEHLTHTIRAIIFPAIVYTLFIKQNSFSLFYVGIALILMDIFVLGIDAFVEKDSRAFMGGLPRWEYILHLFVNGFHFASLSVFFAIKLDFTAEGIKFVPDISQYAYYDIFYFVSINIMPGAILLGLIHVITSIPATTVYWDRLRDKVVCC
jgi:hypothetical protein